MRKMVKVDQKRNQKEEDLGKTIIRAKICALMAHIQCDLCTIRHSNHPN